MPICTGHGGLDATGAIERSDFCKTPTLDGPDRLVCHCGDGHEESFCADLACFAADQQLNLCEPFCKDHGGIGSSDCIDFDYERCIPPGTTRITCGCEDGDEVQVCTSHDCSQGT